MLAKMAMIAMTTSSSISVNAGESAWRALADETSGWPRWPLDHGR
jgi:hypothetical protein